MRVLWHHSYLTIMYYNIVKYVIVLAPLGNPVKRLCEDAEPPSEQKTEGSRLHVS